MACITDVCFYCVFQASGGKREEGVGRERHARRRTCLEPLACFALAFARLKNCRLQDSALKTATSLALNLPLRRFCPCKANHLSVDYLYIALGFLTGKTFLKNLFSSLKKAIMTIQGTHQKKIILTWRFAPFSHDAYSL